MTIRQDILDFLELNPRKTIKEIAEFINAKENVVRTKIFDKKYGLIMKGKVVRVSHEERKGFYSLKNDVINPIESFSEYNELFKKLTKTQINKENLVRIAKETLNLDNIKKLEEMINKNGILG